MEGGPTTSAWIATWFTPTTDHQPLPVPHSFACFCANLQVSLNPPITRNQQCEGHHSTEHPKQRREIFL